MTVETSGWPELPVPRNATFVGFADTKITDPMVPAATVTVPFADNGVLPTAALAVMTSAPLQPVATYVALALPVLVTTGVVIVACPVDWQGELKLTLVDCV